MNIPCTLQQRHGSCHRTRRLRRFFPADDNVVHALRQVAREGNDQRRFAAAGYHALR